MRLDTTSWQFGVDDHVSCVSPSPVGDLVAIGSLSGQLTVIDAVTGAVQAHLPDHRDGVLAVAWSPDGSLLASGGQDGLVRVSSPAGQSVDETDLGGWVSHLAWSPASVLAASAGRTVALLDRRGAVMHRYAPVTSTITAVVWAPNGTRVGVTSYGGVTWFDSDRLPDDAPARRHDFKGSPLSLVLSPDGTWACAGYQDASIHIWPLWSGDDLAMSGYPAKIEHLGFRSDGHWLASACLEELTVWNFSGKGPKGRRPASGLDHEARITWLGWQPGGTVLATGDQSGVLVLWPSPTSTRTALEPLQIIQTANPIASCAWLPDGSALLVGRHDGVVELRRAT